MNRFDTPNKRFERICQYSKTHPIRSFVHRSRPTNKAQKQRLETLRHRLIDISDIPYQTSPLSNFHESLSDRLTLLKKHLTTSTPTALDIGFGMGDSSVALAQHYPNFQWIAVDVYSPGIARLLHLIDQQTIENIYVVKGDVVRLLHQENNGLALCYCTTFFPDPWPKHRHHKRRLIQRHFADLLATHMKPNAYWHIATDSESYAQSILFSITDHAQWKLCHTSSTERCPTSSAFFQPETKFARRSIKEGRLIYTLIYQYKE